MRISDTIHSGAVAIVGMCKNAGKTTVLNSVIKDMDDRTLALTSIGRDGETVDVATVTPKPDVYVHEGTLFATASDILKYCDVTTEILDTCGIYTPLGEVVAARARSDGNIQIAGPSTVEGLRKVHTVLRSFGAEITIFDGAISRKSLSVPTLCEEFILSSGASYSPSMSQTVTDTAYFVRLFLSELADAAVCDADGKFILFTDEEMLTADSGAELTGIVRRKKSFRRIRLHGAVTDSIIKPLTECGLKNTELVADDPSKLLLERKMYELCIARNIQIKVERRSRLCAVTVNPYSAYGAAYDRNAFFDAMQAALAGTDVPIFDVKR